MQNRAPNDRAAQDLSGQRGFCGGRPERETILGTGKVARSCRRGLRDEAQGQSRRPWGASRREEQSSQPCRPRVQPVNEGARPPVEPTILPPWTTRDREDALGNGGSRREQRW